MKELVVARHVGVIVFELENDLIKLVDQPITLVLRKRATHDQCFHLSNERCDLGLGRLCFRKSYELGPLPTDIVAVTVFVAVSITETVLLPEFTA